MVRTVVIFGVCMAVLLGLLKWAEYMFFARDLALEAYIGIVGLFFTILGGWIGWKLTHKPGPGPMASNPNFEETTTFDYRNLNSFNLSPREHEVLILISEGLSYQQIADRLSVSLSTVKTHVSNIFSKMDVQRRTQAVMVAQKNGLIPPAKG